MTFTHDEQTIIDAVSDDPPAAVRGAQRFAAAVEKLDTADQPVDLTAATASNIAKTIDAAVAADIGAESRTRHLAEARTIAANRLEDAWRQSFPDLEERFRQDFDIAAAELTDELAKPGNFDPREVDNKHDQRFARLRDIISRLDDGRRLRFCYAIENITHAGERSLSTVAVLKSGSTSAIGFGNRNGRLTGAAFWIALARSEDIDRIAWQSQSDQRQQPGPAAQLAREQKMRQLHEQLV